MLYVDYFINVHLQTSLLLQFNRSSLIQAGMFVIMYINALYQL